MRSLLTENLVKILSHSDFDPAELMTSEKPVTIYLKWKEENLQALAPMIRLTWNSILRKLINTYDNKKAQGQEKGLRPVLLLIDEGANPAIPSLVQYAATMRSRQMYFQLFIQDLEQLDMEYGEKGAAIIRGNIETWVFYRQPDFEKAKYLSEKVGTASKYAHSYNQSDQQDRSSQSLVEQGVSLFTPQDFMQLKDEKIIVWHADLPPIKMRRLDWRRYAIFRKKHSLPPPKLQPLPEVPKLNLERNHQQSQTPIPYEDPYKILSSRQRVAGEKHIHPSYDSS